MEDKERVLTEVPGEETAEEIVAAVTPEDSEGTEIIPIGDDAENTSEDAAEAVTKSEPAAEEKTAEEIAAEAAEARGLDIDAAMELIEEKRYAPLRQMLREAEPADIAELFDELPKQQYAVVFRILPKELAAEVFVELDSDLQQILIESFSDLELRDVLDELYMDDAADLVEEMPANVVKRILQNVTPEARKIVNELLKYPEDSAGSIMTTEFVRLKQDMTVEEAFSVIRKVAYDKETIYTCYVTDRDSHLIGVVTVKDLLCADHETKIADIMEDHVISVNTLEDKEDVAQAFSKYDFFVLPVVDAEGRLVGIVTFDDAIDVMEEEATEDIEKMAAMLPSDKPYLKTGIWETWKARIPWLLLLMVSATFTGQIIAGFESALAATAILTAYIPMLMDTGGNCGGQASVTVIRGISLDEIEFSDLPQVIWKEIRVGVACGATLSAANFLKIMFIDRLVFHNPITISIALVICGTMLLTVVCAKIIGCMLPLFAKKLGFDPAVMSSPFITTLVDAVSLLIYFNFARTLLGI